MNSRVPTVALFLLVSGMCALIFQMAWLREFRLIFGASTPASAAVLAIFMGGLGLGNAVLGRRADASANPLRLYSRFELGISAACIVSPWLVMLIRQVYFSLGGQETLGIAGATVVRLLLSTLVIGVPTFLMGGTLPAAARAVTSIADRSRRGIGWLYGFNTIGAVLGALVSTFVLLERLGNRETLWAAAAINIVNALLAWKLSQRWSAYPAEGAALKEASPTAGNETGPDPDSVIIVPPPADTSGLAPPLLIYFAAGVAGFVFLLMELVWYRMLGPILGGTTFTFGIILAVALAGIGIGGALYPLFFRDRVPTLRDLALTCGWEALALGVPFALGDRLAILAAALRQLAYFGFSGQAAGWVIVAAIVIFPAALVSGIQFPLLIALLGRGSRDVGRQVGQTVAWNTAGAMAGSLAGGFGLLPLLTAPGAWQLAVLVLAGLALVALWKEFRAERQALPLFQPLAVVLVAGLCLGATGPTAVWRHSGIGAGRALMPAMTHNDLRNWTNAIHRLVLWEQEGQESSVAISTSDGVAFIVNGKTDGNAFSDAGTQIMFPLIGAMLHPHPKTSLVIGLGTGESAGWLAALPSMEHVDVVELEPAIAHVAEVCAPLNHDVLNHPKVRVIFNDGREVLQTSKARYDLIASEPSNPYRAGVANLYTVEFYASVRQRLAPRGLFIQWLQGYEIDSATMRTVLCTAEKAFPHVEIWEAKPSDLVLVCSAEPTDYDLARLQARVQDPTIREALRIGWRTSTVEGVLAHFIANENFVTAVASQPYGWINTDNHNSLEYAFARTVGRQSNFTVVGLREEARQQNMHRPPRLEQGVDWAMVEDLRIALYAGSSDPLPPALFTGEQAIRAKALADAASGASPAGIIAAWKTQSREPEDMIEITMLASLHASLGNEEARPLIERLRGFNALDADILSAMLALRQGKLPEAAGLFVKAFQAMRRDPTGQSSLAEAALVGAAEIAERDPTQARRLFEALSLPFAVMHVEHRRRMTRWMVAQHVGDAAMIDALAEMEPFVPFDREFLESRWVVYHRTKHPLKPRAERDLLEFRRWSPTPLVLLPEDKPAGAQ